MSNIFGKNTLVVNQKFTMIANDYLIMDETGAEIGSIHENMSIFHQFITFFISKKFHPFELNIFDRDMNILATISRGITLWLSKIDIAVNGQSIATIKQKFALMHPFFEIMDSSGSLIASIKGNVTAWDFKITDQNGNEIGTVSKKWNGALKEIFTDSDKYIVNISESVTDITKRTAILSAAAVIDMILKEDN